jgi:hypothetical protein
MAEGVSAFHKVMSSAAVLDEPPFLAQLTASAAKATLMKSFVNLDRKFSLTLMTGSPRRIDRKTSEPYQSYSNLVN